MSLRRPEMVHVKDSWQLLDVLVGIYDAIVAAAKPQPPSHVPLVKAIAGGTYEDIRKVKGDVNGEGGPRAVIATGRDTPLDGLGSGIFAWDPNNTHADDDTNWLQVSGVSVGRWVRIL